MNDRLDRLFELSDSHTSRAAHAEAVAGKDFAELTGNHDDLRHRRLQSCSCSFFASDPVEPPKSASTDSILKCCCCRVLPSVFLEKARTRFCELTLRWVRAS